MHCGVPEPERNMPTYLLAGHRTDASRAKLDAHHTAERGQGDAQRN